MIAQRNARSPRILGIHVLKREDLAFLQEKRATPTLVRLRDSHLQIARLLAAGLSNNEIAEHLGYSPSRISLLSKDPAIIDKVAGLRKEIDAAAVVQIDQINRLQVRRTLMAERQLCEQLEDADETGEPIPFKNLLAAASDGADRIGYGKKSTTVNVNVDFAAKLEAARRRSLPVIDAKAAHGDEAA